MPPGNATLAQALTRLGHLLGNTEYLDVATNTLRWARAIMEQYPSSHYGLITALEEANEPLVQIILRGPVEEMPAWKQAVGNNYAPWRSCYIEVVYLHDTLCKACIAADYVGHLSGI